MWPEAYVTGVVGVGGTGEERDRIVPIQPTEQTLLTNPFETCGGGPPMEWSKASERLPKR